MHEEYQDHQVVADMAPLEWLAGRWTTTEGRGTYPDLPNFQYQEDIQFYCLGRPMFYYKSTSWQSERETPTHKEEGVILIRPGANEVAFVIRYGFGLSCTEEGTFDADAMEVTLETVNVSRTSVPRSPYIIKFKRVFKLLSPGRLQVTLFMQTDVTPLTEHLKAVYEKVEGN